MRQALAFLVLVLLVAGIPSLTPITWSLSGAAAESAATPDPAAITTGTAAGLKGTTYTSPQFGYLVTWESPWMPYRVVSDPLAGDQLRLGTGGITMEFHGFSTDLPIEQALEDFVAARARTHPGVTPQYQAPGGGQAHDSPPLWHFDYTRADGVVMGEVTTALSVASGRGVLMRTVTRPTTDASPRSLYYAVALFLDPAEATTVAQQAVEQSRVPTAGANDLHTLPGTVRLTHSFVESVGNTCTGAGAFRDVGPGLPITVANVVDVVMVTGRVAGVGTLITARSGSGQECVFTFSIANVPTQAFYRISVGTYIERRVVDYATLQTSNWSIEFVL